MSNYRVVQAWTLTKDGAEKRDGWDLLNGDNWCQRFWYKRDAVTAMRQVQAEERMTSIQTLRVCPNGLATTDH